MKLGSILLLLWSFLVLFGLTYETGIIIIIFIIITLIVRMLIRSCDTFEL